mgnify:CR=1 FL=1
MSEVKTGWKPFLDKVSANPGDGRTITLTVTAADRRGDVNRLLQKWRDAGFTVTVEEGSARTVMQGEVPRELVDFKATVKVPTAGEKPQMTDQEYLASLARMVTRRRVEGREVEVSGVPNRMPDGSQEHVITIRTSARGGKLSPRPAPTNSLMADLLQGELQEYMRKGGMLDD